MVMLVSRRTILSGSSLCGSPRRCKGAPWRHAPAGPNPGVVYAVTKAGVVGIDGADGLGDRDRNHASRGSTHHRQARTQTSASLARRQRPRSVLLFMVILAAARKEVPQSPPASLSENSVASL